MGQGAPSSEVPVCPTRVRSEAADSCPGASGYGSGLARRDATFAAARGIRRVGMQISAQGGGGECMRTPRFRRGRQKVACGRLETGVEGAGGNSAVRTAFAPEGPHSAVQSTTEGYRLTPKGDARYYRASLLCSMSGGCREAYVPAPQSAPRQGPRLPRPHGRPSRSCRSEPPPRQGPQAADRLRLVPRPRWRRTLVAPGLSPRQR